MAWFGHRAKGQAGGAGRTLGHDQDASIVGAAIPELSRIRCVSEEVPSAC